VSGPWFRRYFFSFKATTWQGRLVVGAMLAVPLACFLLADQFERWPVVSWALGIVGFIVLVAGFALVCWKTDWSYGRR